MYSTREQNRFLFFCSHDINDWYFITSNISFYIKSKRKRYFKKKSLRQTMLRHLGKCYYQLFKWFSKLSKIQDWNKENISNIDNGILHLNYHSGQYLWIHLFLQVKSKRLNRSLSSNWWTPNIPQAFISSMHSYRVT